MPALALLLLAAPAADLPKTDVFVAGRGGYTSYRIPCVAVTATGTVLAVCEARKNAAADWGHIDLLVRRSRDGGGTWDEPRKLVAPAGPFAANPAAVARRLDRPGETTLHNAVLIPDGQTLHLLYCVNYARVFYTRSTDDGVTFAEATDLTTVFDGYKPAYPWLVVATGPGHGLRLKSGRLAVPVWLSQGTGGGAHRPSVVTTVVSDDAGKTWRRGDVIANETDPLVNPNETTLAELGDGRVWANIRSESPAHRRAVAVSPNGATGWSKPAFVDALVEPICQGSSLALPGRLLYAGPDNLAATKGAAKPGQSRARKNLTVNVSRDDGATWRKLHVIEPGPSGYSDMAALPDGRVLMLYERGDGNGDTASGPARRLTITTFRAD